MENITITTLIENSSSYNQSNLISEHGLSLYIEKGDTKILFDTGQSGNFIKNSKNLNIELTQVDKVILSHGHYDHTGGLREFISTIKGNYTVYFSEKLLNEKYFFTDEIYEYLGNNFSSDFFEKHKVKKILISDSINEIDEGVYLFTNFKKNQRYEGVIKNSFILQNSMMIPDEMDDEVVLGVDTPKGLLLFVGCSHVGILNIIESVKKISGKNIYGVFGGIHMQKASEERMQNTVNYFKNSNIQIFGLAHCSGENMIKKLEKENCRVFVGSTGTSVSFKFKNDQ